MKSAGQIDVDHPCTGNGLKSTECRKPSVVKGFTTGCASMIDMNDLSGGWWTSIQGVPCNNRTALLISNQPQLDKVDDR